jgi:hypothetical protein
VSFGGGIRVTVADAVFSKAVRAANDWSCRSCGRYFPEGSRAGLHCSHFFGRRNASTRHEPLNAFALCAGCHMRFGEHPHEHCEFVKEQLGPIAYAVLAEKRQQILRKVDRLSDKEIAKHYRAELARIEKLRAQGVTGRIELVGP